MNVIVWIWLFECGGGVDVVMWMLLCGRDFVGVLECMVIPVDQVAVVGVEVLALVLLVRGCSWWC